MNDSETKARDRNLAQVEALLGRPATPRGVMEATPRLFRGTDGWGDAWMAEAVSDDAIGLTVSVFDGPHTEEAGLRLMPTQARELASALNALADRIDGRG